MREKKKVHPIAVLPPSLPPDERLKKSVGAIHSSGKLSLVQRKLTNVLLYAAYDNLMQTDTHTIPVPIMCSMLGWDGSNRTQYLKEAIASLQETRLEFNLREDGEDTWESMTMLSYAKIKNGICTYRYDKALAERFYDTAIFAIINLRVQRQLDSVYALNLYENCIRYKNTNTGSTGSWSLDFFREIIGGTAGYYDDFRKLNAKIIKPAIAKINEVSDIVLSVEYERAMRNVVSLKFFVREKTDKEKKEMPSASPGMYFSESVDEYKELRDTKAFHALKKHGITERLAFAWIREKGEQVVLDLVAYTEDRDAKNLINTNTRAYMQSLVKVGAEFGSSEYDKQKKVVEETKMKEVQSEAQKSRLADLEAEYRTEVVNTARNALTLDERHAYACAWFQTEAGNGKDADYNQQTGQFKNSLNKIQFEKIYLAKILTQPDTQAAFIQWLQKVKKLDPMQLGVSESISDLQDGW